jgi:hypothetical protein
MNNTISNNLPVVPVDNNRPFVGRIVRILNDDETKVLLLRVILIIFLLLLLHLGRIRAHRTCTNFVIMVQKHFHQVRSLFGRDGTCTSYSYLYKYQVQMTGVE